MMKNKISIYTDGACSGNPGKGGWGVVLVFSETGEESFISGYEKLTTNNKMELKAAIEGLKSIKDTKSLVEIYTDSQYVKNGINLWINKWKINGWKTANKKEVANKKLWIELDLLTQHHKISWFWVKGHSGNYYNEIADKLAVEAMNN